MTDQNWVLIVGTFLPIAGVLVLLFIPRGEESLIKMTGIVTAAATVGVGIYTLTQFDYNEAGTLQFVVDKPWIDVVRSRFILGIDGISLPLYFLSMVVTLLVMIYSWDHVPEPGNPKAFFILMLILQTGMAGTFVAQDLILFFVFFEIVLLPMYFMIGVWGGEQRQYASLKFFLYTMFGSALMLVAFLAMFFVTGANSDPNGSFAFSWFLEHGPDISQTTALWIFAGMFIGFAVKVPMFPFHTWLPDAHTQAPTQGSVILAAILLKLGTYGFIRIAIPFLPQAAREWAPWIGLLAVIGIIYGALGCLAQSDMKRLIAFSSVAHMGFVMLGISTLTSFGFNAAVFGMVAHGLITGMLFFLAGSVKERYHTLEISRLGGMLKQIPRLGWILGLCAMASLGLPGLAGFWGEFPAILSAYQPAAGLPVETFRTYMVIAAIGTVFAAAYLLWMYQRTAFGEPRDEFSGHGAPDGHGHVAHSVSAAANESHDDIHDVGIYEWIAWTPMVVAIVVFGIFPNLLFKVIDPAVTVALKAFPAVISALVAQASDVPFTSPTIDYHALAPEIVLSVVVCAVLVLDLFLEETKKWITASVAGLGLLASFIPILTLAVDDGPARSMFNGAYVVDDFSLVLKALFVLAGYVVVLLSQQYVEEGDFYEGEYYFLLLSSVLGMVMMASSRDLVSIFVALELLSIPAYMLAAWRKRDEKSNEAGTKYFLLGVFASAVMLYGMSLLYGETGTTLLAGISIGLQENGLSSVSVLAIVFVLVGFGFKVSAVPFHTWAPDTYQGAPTPITAFLSVASKAAGFVALVTLIYVAFPSAGDVWQPLIGVIAALTMTFGNLVALRQTNIVRMLAYSSISQGGFILMPLAVAAMDPAKVGEQPLTAVITYLIVYAAMNLGVFAVVIVVSRKTHSGEISSYGGLMSYAPVLATLMTIFIASLAGVPPLGGWIAKFSAFKAVISAGTGWAYALAVVGAVNSVIAFGYYGTVLREMWMSPTPDGDIAPIRTPRSLAAAMAICAAATIVLGVLPNAVMRFGDLSTFTGAIVP